MDITINALRVTSSNLETGTFALRADLVVSTNDLRRTRVFHSRATASVEKLCQNFVRSVPGMSQVLRSFVFWDVYLAQRPTSEDLQLWQLRYALWYSAECVCSGRPRELTRRCGTELLLAR